ncbi:glutaminase A [Rhodococcus sp. NPDC058505]|uniref:glutaminase A n=1 Tax=unclassified Rhodococcus (in: high G+C Gram-positive bacteria) TaxID=192944 RepID=UPI00364EA826
MRTVVDAIIGEIYEHCLDNRAGALADYIPELAQVPPDTFSLCVATTDGHVYEAGSTGVAFTIQSVSKPLTYGLALADRGTAAVAAKIDVEPSGEPFNEISLDPVTERPRNPMINAGAITAASLIAGADPAERFERVRRCYSTYAGRELAMDERVYASEARTGHRNRAIGHMLRSFGIITDDPDEAVDLYFRQCSINVTCRDLALIAATLANNGTHPRTGRRALSPANAEHVLSVMTSCGMYDAAGEWITQVGLPAKSGVGGGLLAVLPGQIGIAVHSPRLDTHGNSVRGVQACRELSRSLELHFLHVGRAARSAIRSTYTVDAAPSRQRRTPAERAALAEHGARARVYELHGDLLFSGAESAVRAVGSRVSGLDAVVVDLRRVDEVGAVGRRMFADLRADLAGRGCGCAFVDPDGHLGVTASSVDRSDRTYADLDSALEWAETELLDRYCPSGRIPESIDLVDHPALAGLTRAEFDRIATELDIVDVPAGSTVVRRGDNAIGIAMVLSGRISVVVHGGDGTSHRVTTLAPGMTFGEIPTLVGGPFLNDIRADTAARFAILSPDRFTTLAEAEPTLKLAILDRLTRSAYAQLDTAIRSLSVAALPAPSESTDR